MKYDKVQKKNVILTGIQVFFLFFLTIMIAYFYFGFNEIDLKIPINYYGDGISGVAGIKKMLTDGNALLGWPYNQNLYKYSVRVGLLRELFIRLCGIFSEDYFLIYNVSVFVIPIINVFVAFLVLKYMRIRSWIAYLVALTYGFCPYVQYRMGGHLSLAAIECIPLVFLICLWLCEDADYLNFNNKKIIKNKKNLITLFFTWMIANNGMVYYPFFSCFIFVVVGIYITYRDKSIKSIFRPLLPILEIISWLVLGYIPVVIGQIKGFGNLAANGTSRNALRAVEYGLDLKSLFLSPNGFGISELLNKYSYLLTDSNEKQYAYMGIIGIIGFSILFIKLLFKKNIIEQDVTKDRINMLAIVNICMIVLGVSGGIGVVVAVFFPYISCYNRISPFILYASLLTVAMLLEDYFRKKSGKKIIKIAIIFSFVLCFYEQCKSYIYISGDINKENVALVTEDSDFFSKLDNAVEKDGMVYMLPYMRSFENGNCNNISDYDHLKGYLFTEDIKWSYGAVYGSPNDEWYFKTSNCVPDKLVRELVDLDFSGIYINLNGYDEEEGKLLLKRLCEVSNCKNPIQDTDGRRYYISLDNYTKDKSPLYTWIMMIYENNEIFQSDNDINDISVSFLEGSEKIYQEIYEMISENRTDREYVLNLYENVLERTPSDDELNGQINYLKNKEISRYDMFICFITSEEFISKYAIE